MRAANFVPTDVWDEREELICVCKADEDDKDRSGDECEGDENTTSTTSLLRGKISRTDAKPVRTGDVSRGAWPCSVPTWICQSSSIQLYSLLSALLKLIQGQLMFEHSWSSQTKVGQCADTTYRCTWLCTRDLRAQGRCLSTSIPVAS